MATITSSSTSSRLVITLGGGGICRRTKALYTKARTGQSGVPVSVAVAVWPGPCPCWCPCSMPTPGHYLFNSSTLTTLPGHGYTGNLGAATETRFACQAIRLPRQSVCLPVWLTPYCAIHMNNQRKAVGPISLLLASMHWPSIHSVRMCVWVCWCGCGHGCLLGVRWVYLLPAQGLPHIFILNLSLSSWQPHKYIHTHTYSYTGPCSWPTRHWTFLYNSWNAHHSHNRNYDCHSAMCPKVGQDNAYAQSTLLVILAV